MAKRDDIVIGFGGDDTRFRRVARRVETIASSISSSFAELGSTIATTLGFGAGVAGGGAIAAIAQLTRELDDLGKAAKGLNTTVEGLSALQFAIGQTTTLGDEQFTTALQRLVKQIGQANRGVAESVKLFEELGLSYEYLATLDSDKAFLEVADAIGRIEDEYKQASIAQKLFEDNWRALLPILRMSREEIQALIDKAYEIGVPTEEAAEAAARFNDSLNLLSRNLQGLAYRYGPDVIDFLNNLIIQFSDLSAVTREGMVREMVRLDKSAELLVRTMENLKDSISEQEYQELENELAGIRSQYLELADAISKADQAGQRARNRTTNRPTPPVVDPFGLTGGGGGTGGGGRGGGGGGGRGGGRPAPFSGQTAGDALVANRLAAQRGDITNEEYRRRRSEIIRDVPPGESLEGPVGPSGGGSISADYVAVAIAQAVEREINSRVFKPKVDPQLFGDAATIEWSTQDGVEKEGSNSGM